MVQNSVDQLYIMITLKKKYTYTKKNFMEYKTCKIELDIQYHQLLH